MSAILPKRPLPWQTGLWSNWLDLLENRRLPHAVLISGMAGLGKGHLAEAFTHALLCQAQAGEKPCGQCKPCRLIAADGHPDLRKVEPEKTGKAIKVDQIRKLVDFLAGTAQQGGWKCVVIQPADAMNSNAANALLKSLEEPPAETVIILVSASPGRLMATLRSRCRQLQLKPPPPEQAMEWLEPRVGSRARALLTYSHGAPCAALEAYENNRLEGRQDLLEALLSLAEGRSSAIAAAKRAQSLEAVEAMDQILALLNQLARSRQAQTLPEGYSASWEEVAKGLNEEWLFRFRDKLIQAKSMLLSGSNPNHQLLWEETMLDWQALTRRRQTPPTARALL